MFTPFLIVSVATAWQPGVNKRLCGSWGLMCADTEGAGQGVRQRGSLRDVDHQVIIPVQGVVPAACIAEHLPRNGAQDRRGRHLGWGQWGQGCPHAGPRTPAWEGQRPSHGAVGGSYRHLQQRGETQGGPVREALGPPGGWHCPLRQFQGMGKGAKAHSRGSGHSQASHGWNQGACPTSALQSLTPASAWG